MIKIILLLLCKIYILTVLSIYNVSAHDCISNSESIYCKLGTKTPYRFIANYNDSHLEFPGCKEQKIWLTIRHGTRYPGKENVNSMINDLPKLQNKIIESFKHKQSKLSSKLIKKLSKWKLFFDRNHTMLLAEQGEYELTDLAERMQSRFPTLFLEDYDKEVYKFKYTATQRTECSAKSFTRGLFGEYYSANISFPEAVHKDPILRFYKRCHRWRTEVDNNPDTFKEKNIFIESKLFQKILNLASKRVGFKLDYESINLMYIMCAFEVAWNKTKRSPWCDILTFDDFELLEFIEDLQYYWVDGYGFSVNYMQACSILLDMFKFFDSKSKLLVSAYFTHSGTILKMLSLLGIAKDENVMTNESFYDFSRKWKVSLIDSFASNIAFVLYNCDVQGPSVLLLHQERAIQIPGCPTGWLCPLSIMKKIFPATEEECPFDIICFNK